MAFEIDSEIYFDSENIELPSLEWDKLKDWITSIIQSYHYQLGEISYIFCDDDKILEVNREYLNHDYYTDIITFDYCEEGVISGDLFISLDTVKSNAEKFEEDYFRELLRVVIHGILHLCGLKDKSDEDALKMRQAEEDALTVYNTL